MAFLDSDAFPEPGWLDPLVARLEDDRVAVVGSRILRGVGVTAAAPPQHGSGVRLALALRSGRRAPRRAAHHGNQLCDRLERVPEPPFDESIGRKPGWPLAMEENVLCDAARADGWRVVYEPASVVRHRIPARAGELALDVEACAYGRPGDAHRGRFEPLPRPPLKPRDRLFQAIVAPAFFAGLLARQHSRDAAV